MVELVDTPDLKFGCLGSMGSKSHHLHLVGSSIMVVRRSAKPSVVVRFHPFAFVCISMDRVSDCGSEYRGSIPLRHNQKVCFFYYGGC